MLDEEMQLNYQMLNLQFLLQGSLNFDYTPDGRRLQHVTLGFPIKIETPPNHLGEVAEVEAAVCNAHTADDPQLLTVQTAAAAALATKRELPAQGTISPHLRTIIPEEKTYNTANIVSGSTQLGVGAVIGNIINIGASYLHGNQTYYVVRAQDTVAVQRSIMSRPIGKTLDDRCPDNQKPVVFAWQFRPVLGQKTVEQGIRHTMAQVSLLPADPEPRQAPKTRVFISMCWRKYDASSSVVGAATACVDEPAREVVIQYSTLALHGISYVDNADGTVTAKVTGAFQTGTRVGLGDVYLTEASAGFENTGSYIRFSAPNQALAGRRSRLIAPDGLETDLVVPASAQNPMAVDETDKQTVRFTGSFTSNYQVYVAGKQFTPDTGAWPLTIHGVQNTAAFGAGVRLVRPDATHSACWIPKTASLSGNGYDATVTPFSDTMVKVTVPLWQCMESQSVDAYPPVVVLGGKVFGLSDAPFLEFDRHDPTQITFLVPTSLAQGQSQLTFKRLFLDDTIYGATYTITNTSRTTGVTGVLALGTSTAGATFALTGSNLGATTFLYPDPKTITPNAPGSSDTFHLFVIPTKLLASVKEIVLQVQGGAPIVEVLPAVSAKTDDDSTKAGPKISILNQDSSGTTYLLTGPKGSQFNQATFLDPPSSSVSTGHSGDTFLEFSLSKQQVAGYANILLQPATPTVAAKAGKAPPAPKTPAPVLIALPSAQKDMNPKTPVLTPDTKGVAKGSTGPYTIHGSGLQSVADVIYLKASVPFTSASDGTSLVISQLPAQLTAAAGAVPVALHLMDGSSQYFFVKVTQ